MFSGLGPSPTEMSRITRVSHGSILKAACAVFVRAIALVRGTRASIGDANIKRRPCPSACQYVISIQNQGGACDAVFLSARPKMLDSSWVSLKTTLTMPQTDSWPSPPTMHVSRQEAGLEPSAHQLRGKTIALVRWFHAIGANFI